MDGDLKLIPGVREVYELGNSKGEDFLYLSWGDRLVAKMSERQLLKVVVEDVYMSGWTQVVFNKDHVMFGTRHIQINDYTGDQHLANALRVPGEMVALWTAQPNNYGHVLEEFLSSLVLTRHFLPDAKRLLVPDTPLVRKFAALLAEYLEPVQLVWFDGQNREKLWHFERLVKIDWRAGPRDKVVPQASLDDIWDRYTPPGVGILAVRELLMAQLAKDVARAHSTPRPAPKKVVFISRMDAPETGRRIQNEALLVSALKTLLGEQCLEVFVASPHNVVDDYSGNQPDEYKNKTAPSLLDQVHLFSRAEMIISPHGAGLVNMMYAPANASVVYFPLKSMVDQHFARLAAVLGFSLHPVSDMNAFYSGTYFATEHSVQATAKVIREIMLDKGWVEGDACGQLASSHADTGGREEL